MIDIEAQVKMNDLARDLLSKGLAPSSDDAYRMAQSIISGTETPKAEGISSHPKREEGTRVEQGGNEDKKDAKQALPSGSMEKYEILLERYNRSLRREIEGLKEMVKSFSATVGMLQQDLAGLKRQARDQQHRAQESSGQKKDAPFREGQDEQANNTNNANGKNDRIQSCSCDGDFSKDDVSVEKIFYFGNR